MAHIQYAAPNSDGTGWISGWGSVNVALTVFVDGMAISPQATTDGGGNFYYVLPLFKSLGAHQIYVTEPDGTASNVATINITSLPAPTLFAITPGIEFAT